MRAFFIYGSYRLLGALAGPLPPRLAYPLARQAGILIYFALPRLRKALAHNIRHVLGREAGEERVKALSREACVNIAKGHYDLFRVSRLSREAIQRIVRIEGWEHLELARKPGKGVIVVSAHFGNVDVVVQAPVIYGLPLTGAAMHVQPERLFQYTLRLRQSHGLRLIPADGPLLGLVRALKRGEIIGLPCDRVTTDNTRPIEFFGVPAPLPEGPVRLALKTGAAILPAFALRLPDNTFLIEVEPPLDLQRSGDHEADVVAGLQQVARVMERHISRHPEQWLIAAPLWPLPAS